MAISTTPKPTVYLNVCEDAGPGVGIHVEGKPHQRMPYTIVTSRRTGSIATRSEIVSGIHTQYNITSVTVCEGDNVI